MGTVTYTKTMDEEEMSHYLGTTYMLANKAEFEPGRTSDFILKIKFNRDLYDMNGTMVCSKTEATEALALSLRDYTGPELSLEKLTIRTGNGVMQYAGTPNISDGSISFTDYIGKETESILLAWYTMAHNPMNDKIGFKEYYGQDGLLYKWAPNGTRQISWRLYGCWINTFNLGQFSRNQPDVRQLSTNIVYDKAVPWQLPDYTRGDKKSTWAKTSDWANKESAGNTNYIGTLTGDKNKTTIDSYVNNF